MNDNSKATACAVEIRVALWARLVLPALMASLRIIGRLADTLLTAADYAVRKRTRVNLK